MIFRKTGLWVIGLLIILFPVAAAADEGSTHGRWWQSPAMAEKINLSPQERQTLDDLYTQKRKDLFDMRAEVERQRLEMDSLLEAPSLDQRAAFKRFKKLEAKRQKLSEERFRYLLDVRRILGRDRYLKLMEAAKEERSKRGYLRQDRLDP